MRIKSKLKKFAVLVTPPIVMNLYSDSKTKPQKYSALNQTALEDFSVKFEVLDFSYIDVQSPYELKWGWWSRVFEYELAISKLKKLGVSEDSVLHNTCWGYHGSHILFKNELEGISKNVTNSDILASEVPNTCVLDLRSTPNKELLNKFDFVINISTIEEIPFSHIKVIENLLSMVKRGGYLIATFDIPGLQLKEIEDLFKVKISETPEPVTGRNSPYPMYEFENLKVGYFVLRKV
jgi:hypothetical protein